MYRVMKIKRLRDAIAQLVSTGINKYEVLVMQNSTRKIVWCKSFDSREAALTHFKRV